jgi:hypothetical protein
MKAVKEAQYERRFLSGAYLEIPHFFSIDSLKLIGGAILKF